MKNLAIFANIKYMTDDNSPFISSTSRYRTPIVISKPKQDTPAMAKKRKKMIKSRWDFDSLSPDESALLTAAAKSLFHQRAIVKVPSFVYGFYGLDLKLNLDYLELNLVHFARVV
jgi:hypothetical protein